MKTKNMITNNVSKKEGEDIEKRKQGEMWRVERPEMRRKSL